ncbi:MAG: response regulator, partial [Pseudomonadota bacterium]
GYATRAITNDTEMTKAAAIDPDGITAMIGLTPWWENQPLAQDNIPRVLIEQLGESTAHTGKVSATLNWPLAHQDVEEVFKAIQSGDWSALEQQTSTVNANEPNIQFRGAKILAADDSIVNREVLGEALGRLGLQMVSANDGLEAVDAIKTGDFDLVFMDGSMPNMDGFEATRTIRSFENEYHLKPLPIIALTAHVVGPQAELWRDSGMDDCITKPFTLSMIENCLRKWLPDHIDTATPSASSENETVQAAEHAPAVSPDPASTELLDPTILDDIRNMQSGGVDLVGRVISLYRTHAPQSLATLREIWSTATDDDIAEAVHALKSLSRNIGAVAVSELCEVAETDARARTLQRTEKTLTDLEDAVQATLEALPANPGSTVTVKSRAPATR